ncbi:ABC transporter ATP-binding protein [Nonomuraea rhodomycinica]|uniref:ABC transporter ATP-binding protein n=2 Tax=Nonomuraea rhodomycinica TaxID=1712872 RepID=A0A7Y6MB14_9ACTN|nr:ABC transporter ATP-binding protein [Nonomuraea rhodomycinica]
MRPGRRAGLALGAAVAAMTVLPLAGPQLTRRFVDDAIAGAGTGRLTLIALAALAAAVAGQAARLAAARLAGRLAWDGTDRLRERLAAHALGLDMDFHGRHTPGELIERVDGDVAAVSGFVVAFLMDVVAGALLLAGVLGVVLAADPRLGCALLAYCVLIGLATTRAQRLAVPSAAAARAAGARLYGEMEERIAGAEDLRANGAGEHVVTRFLGTAAAWYRAEHRADRIGSALLAGTSVAFAAGTALMLALAAWARSTGTLTVGTAVLVFQCTVMVRAPFERLIDRLRDYQGALAGFHRIGGLLAERRTLPAPARPRRLPEEGPLALELDGVAFAYDAPEQGGGGRVLSDVTLRLAPGETLGLVGRTGSGKTTITRLALRLYDPVAGAVRVGGVDLRDADEGSLRRRVYAVTQDVRLFDASVRDNLTLFRPSPGDDVLRRALADAGLGDWLAGLPDGLDTELRGVSAGEAQLLALARAFLADPGLVVLDEASSRLDPATERRVERGMDRLLAGRTGVIVAHRLSSLARVDKIAVLSRGRVVEYGPRAELAADPGSRFSALLDLAGVPR